MNKLFVLLVATAALITGCVETVPAGDYDSLGDDLLYCEEELKSCEDLLEEYEDILLENNLG